MNNPAYTTVVLCSFISPSCHAGLNNLLSAYEDKSAVAVCTFAFSPGKCGDVLLFRGETEVSQPHITYVGIAT